ncbi:ATP-binding protein [Vitreoscilla massiliensis]|uniref:ATP-binding protein n=1 Tax=Vitreoscilla massiliensis TaxID=1689272 RepID=A0ABY4E6S1_9NEIS|nr:AAA family ATPase [Vitreoscilla massiliensis]UOO91041.1 ATP-binding protein [Vitreoscilla massiliensis]
MENIYFLILVGQCFWGLDRKFVFLEHSFNDYVDNFLFDRYIDSETIDDDGLFYIQGLLRSYHNHMKNRYLKYSTGVRNQILEIFLEKKSEKITNDLLDDLVETAVKSEKIWLQIQESINQGLLRLPIKVVELLELRVKEFSEAVKISSPLFMYAMNMEKHEELAENMDMHFRVYKVLKVLEKLEDFGEKSNKKILEFERIINSFLIENNKKIKIDGNGIIKIKHGNQQIDIENISSGERQLIILFGNVIFNEEIEKQQVFIIDEPELSLHLSWQDKFTSSLYQYCMENNKKLQLILATHSPSIINDYSKKLKFVRGYND